MNTEQLKTKEELLDKYASEIGNYKDFRGILVAYRLYIDDPNRVDWVVDKAMQDFAQQEIQRDRESRWISVKERLPEEGKEVLVWSDRYGRTFATLAGQNKCGSIWMYLVDPIVTFNAPTHWQPLPAPPKQLTP